MKHAWFDRASLFDFYIDQLQLEQGIQARLEMYRRHARIACNMLEKLELRIKSLKPSSLSPDESALRDSTIRSLLDHIGGELHAQYVLTYVPTNDAAGFHNTTVTVDRPNLTVRSRAGYFPISRRFN